MNFFLVVDFIVYFFIISHSYRLICKGQINRKELFFFGAYTLLVEAVLELPFYLLYLDGLGLATFLFPLGLYSYFRWIKQYEKNRGLFLSLLLSLLYESTHNFLSVTFSSEEFSKQLEEASIKGFSTLTFIIGGSLGLSSSVKNRANLSVSFGRLTLPHQLMRLVLVEQIYRAFTIQQGSPYHK